MQILSNLHGHAADETRNKGRKSKERGRLEGAACRRALADDDDDHAGRACQAQTCHTGPSVRARAGHKCTLVCGHDERRTCWRSARPFLKLRPRTTLVPAARVRACYVILAQRGYFWLAGRKLGDSLLPPEEAARSSLGAWRRNNCPLAPPPPFLWVGRDDCFRPIEGTWAPARR